MSRRDILLRRERIRMLRYRPRHHCRHASKRSLLGRLKLRRHRYLILRIQERDNRPRSRARCSLHRRSGGNNLAIAPEQNDEEETTRKDRGRNPSSRTAARRRPSVLDRLRTGDAGDERRVVYARITERHVRDGGESTALFRA